MTSKHITDEQIFNNYNGPIGIHDASSMLRRSIKPNDPPFTQTIVKKNNAYVDEWYDRVLKRICNKQAQIPSGRVFPSWSIFFEGKEIYKLQESKTKLPVIPLEIVTYWVNFLKTKSVGELYDAGLGVVGFAWQIMSSAIRHHFAEEKWKCIYSESTDPYDWEKRANNFPDMIKGRPLPFGLDEETHRDIEEKIRSLMMTRVSPDN